METLREVLKRRDGLTDEQITEQINDFRSYAEDDIMMGDLGAVEELFQSEFGLEPDYLMEVIF